MPSSRVAARTPDTLCLLSALTVVGVIMTVTGAVPHPIALSVPEWAARMWSASQAAAAAVSLIGLLHPDPLTGWVLEAWGRAGLAVTGVGYVVALADHAHQWEVALAIALVASITISSVWRLLQVARPLRAALAAWRTQRGRRRAR